MSEAGDALAAMEENMAEHLAFLPRHLSGGIVHDERDLLLVDAGVPSDTFNAVCRARLAAHSARRRIAWAVRHFRENHVPFTWWVGPTSHPSDLGVRLEAEGLIPGEIEVGMILDLTAIPQQSPPLPHLQIREVGSESDLLDYVRVIAANWDPPDLNVIDVYRRAAGIVGLSSPAHYYLGCLDGEPVAASECFLARGIAGIYNVVTLPPARRRGIGTALTVAALHRARAEGYRLAGLQASRMGQRMYARLGFTDFGEFHEYH